MELKMIKTKQNAMTNKAFQKAFATAAVFAASVLPAMAQGGSPGNEEFIHWMLIVFGMLFLVIIIIMNNVIKSLAGNRELWKSKGSGDAAKVMAFLAMMSSGSMMAATPKMAMVGLFDQFSSTMWFLLAFDLFLAIVIIAQLIVFRKLIEALKQKDAPEQTELVEEEVAVAQESLFMKKVMSVLTKSVPVEQEEEVLTDHEYDGIKELDNVLPPWWVAMFYATIVFAFVYLVHYHVLGTGDLQIAEYEASVVKAEEEIAAYMAIAGEQVDENTVTLVADASRLSNGEKIYFQHCVTCHGEEGQGGVGPNFADEYWIHGGSINDVFATVKYGVPAKGMISWRAQLSPKDMQDVSSFIFTFQGTNPSNQKASEGELYVPKEASEEPNSDEELEGEEGLQNEEPDDPDGSEDVANSDESEN